METLKATWRRARIHNVAIVAAGVAFYGFLSIFPALAAAVSIYGLVSDPADLQTQLDSLSGVVPAETLDILSQQMSAVAASPENALGLGAAFGILLAVWSVKRGMDAAITALNIAHGVEEETRGFLRLNALSLTLSFLAVIGALLIVGALVLLPVFLQYILEADPSLAWLPWPIVLVVIILALAVLYRVAPDRRAPPWRAVFPGAVLGGVLWFAISVLFSIYAANFASYNETYGSLSAIVVLMLWLYFSSYSGLFGAELNAERESHASLDLSRVLPSISDL